MSRAIVNPLLERLAQVRPLAPERFATALGAPLQLSAADPFWKFYTFALPEGPFAGGELRLSVGGAGALLIVATRDPPGLGPADVDRAALGPRLGMRPSPDIQPEGVITEYFRRSGPAVALQWTYLSRRLRSLVLTWDMAKQ